MAVLQAFADDSASYLGDQRLYVAGYLNHADKWMLFAKAWDEELRCPPAIVHLKMADAFALKGQFRGWRERDRDEKLRGLARVVRHFAPVSFEVSVSAADYRRLVTPAAPRGLGSPHFPCCFGVVSSVARYAASSRMRLPIDFIFDQQDGVDDDLRLYFDYMKRSLPRAARKLIAGTPTFGDDAHILPLQAADMLAWHLRREHETSGSHTGSLRAESLYGSEHVATRIEEHSLGRWADAFGKLPGVAQLQTKHRWRAFRRELGTLLSQGYLPPHGTRWRNFRRGAVDAISRLLSRARHR